MAPEPQLHAHLPSSRPEPLRDRLRHILSATYLRKWVVLGTVIGLVAGLGAVAFINALEFATHYLIGVLGGYHPPTPIGEGHSPG